MNDRALVHQLGRDDDTPPMGQRTSHLNNQWTVNRDEGYCETRGSGPDYMVNYIIIISALVVVHFLGLYCDLCDQSCDAYSSTKIATSDQKRHLSIQSASSLKDTVHIN